MVMPIAPAPISIGQAYDECRLTGRPVSASNAALSKLAGVAPGQRYAWSWWSGKSSLKPINDAQFARFSVRVDRLFRIYINFRTGEQTSWVNSWNNQAGRTAYSPLMPPIANIAEYRSVSCSFIWEAGGRKGDPRVFVLTEQQPSAANGFVGTYYINDDAVGGAEPYNVVATITCIP